MSELRHRLNARLKTLGWSFEDAAAFVGISGRTLRKKCNEPDTLTVLELKRILSLLTDAQMRDVMREVGL